MLIFDLNFRPSFRLLKKGDYIESIAASLPQTDEIKNIAAFPKCYVRQKLNKA